MSKPSSAEALSLDSASLSPLPTVLFHGLIAVSTLGLCSFLCSISLFLYLTYRLISWRLKSGYQAPINQSLLLIYNLLLADIQQSLASLINLASLRKNAIVVGSPECWAQGWFISIGDLSSSVFILVIAAHTFMSVVRQYRLSTITFYCGVAGCWIFIYAMATIGPLLHRHDFYVRAGAWCGISQTHQVARFWLHYFWIFIAMFSTVILYTLIFLYLRRSLIPRSPISSDPTGSYPSIRGTTPFMLLYPFIYIICTAPLAAGRIADMVGWDLTLPYLCVAGSMISCNGWLDVLLYASTRSEIVFSKDITNEATGLETFAFFGRGHMMGTVTTVQGGGGDLELRRRGSESGFGRHDEARGRESRENLYGLAMGQIGVKESVQVTVEHSHGDVDRSSRLESPDGSGTESVKSLRL